MSYNWSDKSIMVVEDDESSSYLFSEVLKKTNAKVSCALNGQDAIDIIKENPNIDVVLMDIFLPKVDGLTATREIKKINSSIFVIAQSAYTHEVNMQNAKDAGADDFLPKPVNLKLLLSKIESYFAKNQ